MRLQDNQLRAARHARQLLVLIGLIFVATATMEFRGLWPELAALGFAPSGMSGVSGSISHPTGLTVLCDAISTVAVLVGLVEMLRLLAHMTRTGRFSATAARRLRGFAAAIVIAGASTSVVPIVVAFVRYLDGSRVGHATVVTGSDILLLLVGTVLLAVTNLLATAHRAQDELEQIV